WMLNPESPLYIRPQFSPSYLMWLYRFWRACRPEPYRQGLEATSRLGQRAFEIFDEWVADGIDFEMHSYGLLFAYRTLAEMEKDLAAFDLIHSYGYQKPTPVTGAAVQEAEPVLSD